MHSLAFWWNLALDLVDSTVAVLRMSLARRQRVDFSNLGTTEEVVDVQVNSCVMIGP